VDAAIAVEAVHHRYGRRSGDALHGVTAQVPAGSTCALLGPNGAGKSTLLQLVVGLRRLQQGAITVLGHDATRLPLDVRARITYVSDDIALPGTTLAAFEAYLAPFYPRWDPALAASLRERFALDPRRRLTTLSKGEKMKAALVCALAPRPALLLLDEPFGGIDVAVREELARGLFAASADEGTTVLLASHDLDEIERMVDHVIVLARGRVQVAEPLDTLRARSRRVTVTGDPALFESARLDASWRAVETSGHRMAFVAIGDDEASVAPAAFAARFAGAEEVDVAGLTLRELYLALTTGRPGAPADAVRAGVAA
jgi:ABC-2 type transport system ATP-binding protein